MSMNPYGLLHREIMQAPKGVFVRFRTQDKLDCRTSNLFLSDGPKGIKIKAEPENVSDSRNVFW